MISLRRSIDKVEEQEQRFQEAVKCYLAALKGFGENLVPVAKELSYDHRCRLIELSKAVGPNPSKETLQGSRATLGKELKEYHDQATELLEKKEGEIKEILGVLAEAVTTLTTQNEAHHSKLGDFTKQIEMVSRMTSLGEIRRRLVHEVTQLKTWISASEREKQQSLEQLRGELKTFRKRVEKAERMAFTDSLTGVANRAEGEQKLNEFIRAGDRFSILLFDLNNFKGINDRYGHQVGDVVLKIFASRLAQHVRPDDTVCRWGGDEFLVILVGCNLDSALGRAKTLAELCSGDFSIPHDGSESPMTVDAAVGAAEFWPGEKCEDLFARADKFLYREKELPTLGAKRPGLRREPPCLANASASAERELQ